MNAKKKSKTLKHWKQYWILVNLYECIPNEKTIESASCYDETCRCHITTTRNSYFLQEKNNSAKCCSHSSQMSVRISVFKKIVSHNSDIFISLPPSDTQLDSFTQLLLVYNRFNTQKWSEIKMVGATCRIWFYLISGIKYKPIRNSNAYRVPLRINYNTVGSSLDDFRVTINTRRILINILNSNAVSWMASSSLSIDSNFGWIRDKRVSPYTLMRHDMEWSARIWFQLRFICIRSGLGRRILIELNGVGITHRV